MASNNLNHSSLQWRHLIDMASQIIINSTGKRPSQRESNA